MNDAIVSRPVEPPVLELRAISKSFGALEVLSDISLTVARGETVCIVGPSGSGKSTLLRCINWLEEPDTGAVFLNGRRVGMRTGGHISMSDSELAQIRTRIGMVFQPFALWPHLTVLQNVMEAPLHVQKRPRAEVREAAEALLQKVGLGDKRDVFPAQLSGGLAVHPDLLLLAEPPSALDPELVGEVILVMRQLARDGMTMVIVTHEMGFARDAATRMVFLDRGQVVETGAPAQFFSAPATLRARQFLQRYAAASATAITAS